MEPLIRNTQDVFDGTRSRLLWLDDNPPTCTLTYSEIQPEKTIQFEAHQIQHDKTIQIELSEIKTDKTIKFYT